MDRLDVAIGAARAAGDLLMDRLGKLTEVRYKSLRDPVSEADRASERLIAGIIKEAFPSDGFLGEEETSWEARGGDGGGPRWIVDPLDGTVNFAHAYPCFCVSIACEEAGEITMGVVYDPFNDEIFSARKGEGATLNELPLKVSATDELIRCLVVTGFPYDTSEDPGRIFVELENMVRAAQGVRRDGSAALDLCYLAAGRFDGFYERRLKPWDTAAGMLIAREAGGLVTDYSGREYNPYMDEILATNGFVHEQMMGVLKDAG